MDRHRIDMVSLVFGLVFLGLAAAFTSDAIEGISIDSDFVWPILLGIGGLAILFGSPDRSTDDRAATK